MALVNRIANPQPARYGPSLAPVRKPVRSAQEIRWTDVPEPRRKTGWEVQRMLRSANAPLPPAPESVRMAEVERQREAQLLSEAERHDPTVPFRWLSFVVRKEGYCG